MQTQKFRLTVKEKFWELMVIPFAFLFMAGGLFIGWMALLIFEKGESGLLRLIFPGFFFIPALGMVIVSIMMIFIAIGRILFSYLIISGQGLEYRFWPLHRIRCGWLDVGEIKKSVWSFQGDILMLRNAEAVGFHLFWDLSSGKSRFIKTLPQIPIYKFNGWSTGELRSELEKYAPVLFVTKVS
jgi:hypothetical protein